MIIPKDFTILRQTEDLIEIKSKYHYWRMTLIPDTNTYLLSHKYRICDNYHKQKLRYGNPSTATDIFSHIKSHDDYISNKIKIGSSN